MFRVLCTTLFNEIFLLQTLTFSVVILLIKVTSILSLWYLSGLYLLLFGFFLLLLNGDIFVGFLWVVDLGVGLIFFIFILHFSNFLYQKAQLNMFNKLLIGYFAATLIFAILLYFLVTAPTTFIQFNFKFHWMFQISWYCFYSYTLTYTVSILQLLRQLYFYTNSFEFFLINFMLLYGILTSIVLSFTLNKMFSTSTLPQFLTLLCKNTLTLGYFIRQQNFIQQQNTSTGTRVWKKKRLAKPDF